MKLTRGGLAIALTFALALANQAHAASIAGSMSEPFAYADGTMFPTTGETLKGGTGWNAAGDNSANSAGWGTGIQNNGEATGLYRKATTAGLTYTATGYFPASGNKLALDSVTPPNASQSVSRNFGGQTIDAGTTYFSFLIRRDNDTLRTANLALFQLVGTTATERLTFGQIGAAVSGSLAGSNGKVALIYNNTNPANVRSSTVDMGTGVTHLIVAKIEWNQSALLEKVTAWVDPTDVSTEAAAAAAQWYSQAEFDITQINFARPFTGNNAATTPVTGASQASYDELRLGGTWESVTSAPAVPEPASFALIAFGGLLLGAFRKRS